MIDRPEWAEPQAAPLGEAEALLSGRFVEFAESRGWDIPAWAWLNLVAHADMARLVRLAAVPSGRTGRRPGQGQTPQDWNAVVGAVARDLLACCRSDDRHLSRLQRRALIPLELALIESEGRGTGGVTPQMLARLCQAAVHGHPSVGWPAF